MAAIQDTLIETWLWVVREDAPMGFELSIVELKGSCSVIVKLGRNIWFVKTVATKVTVPFEQVELGQRTIDDVGRAKLPSPALPWRTDAPAVTTDLYS